jgi:[acyl-carrier-protein] S-malonyltransferase
MSATIELPPAGTLSGLVRRDLAGTVTLALKAPEDLDKVAGLISDHASVVNGDPC